MLRAMITSVWLLTAVAAVAAPIAVKVTGGASDAASGYYVEYTINGNKYRSDEVGERINDVAWANMSAEDKKKTMGYFTFDADRYEQFGKEFGIQMGREHNAEWIRAAEELNCEDLTIVTHDESATLLERGHRIVVVPAWKFLLRS